MSGIAAIAMAVLSAGLLDGIAVPPGEFTVRMERNETGLISYLGWDTEGTSRESINLLYEPVRLDFLIEREWKSSTSLSPELKLLKSGPETHFNAGNGTIIKWNDDISDAAIRIMIEIEHPENAGLTAVRMTLPFDPKSTATTVLPSEWMEGARMRLPVLINAPDLGAMRLSVEPGDAVTGRLTGTREGDNRVDFTLEWAVVDADRMIFTLEPSHVPLPEGLADEELWRAIRRGWLNMLQPSAEWGSKERPQYAPAGLLSNNVVSDPVSCVLHMMSDHVLLAPRLASDVDAAPLLRNTVDWWLDNGIEPSGEMRSWRQVTGMPDANAGPLIGAWCYVEASGDRVWLERRIKTLERLADYLANRDIDGDGLVETVYSGNYGTQIGRLGGSAYDTINTGHKDGYCNALIYRAWRGLADLESKLSRTKQAERYNQLADKLKAAYQPTLFNPKTGWMAWWRSEDGELHDLAAPMNTSIAVMYGLVEPENGRSMLNKLWAKMEEVGFSNFSIGTPLTLIPVRKGDYSQPKPGGTRSYGQPERDDGSDAFQQYLNGGCCVSDAYYFITALNIVGETEKADRILNAMLKRQVEGIFPNGGGFQNGVIDQFPLGAEFMDWEGNTCGYEGHLVYSFSFLQAALLREPAIRARVLRPLIVE
jgi:hypothetical protein